jgi:hypothetical protein
LAPADDNWSAAEVIKFLVSAITEFKSIAISCPSSCDLASSAPFCPVAIASIPRILLEEHRCSR